MVQIIVGIDAHQIEAFTQTHFHTLEQLHAVIQRCDAPSSAVADVIQVMLNVLLRVHILTCAVSHGRFRLVLVVLYHDVEVDMLLVLAHVERALRIHASAPCLSLVEATVALRGRQRIVPLVEHGTEGTVILGISEIGNRI